MSVLHPWAIGLGTAALLLPILIHWLTRPRPVRMPISTLRFVRQAIRQQRSRHRLRDWLILALRTLAVACIGLALARPLVGSRPLVGGDEPANAVRVVILDVSQSMAAVDHGMAAVERARAAASRFLSDQRGLKANLILAGAAPQAAFAEPSGNFAALREELGRCASRPERLNIKAALDSAGQMLAQAPGGSELRRELVVISDFQRTAWASADFSVLPESTRIQLESVAPASTPDNVGLLAVHWPGRGEAGQATTLEVEVGNYTSAARPIQVEVAVGSTLRRLEGTCPPMATLRLSDSFALAEAGWRTGEARLLDLPDALAADNTRAFAVDVQRPPRYLLLTRQPASLKPSSTFYLQQALERPSTPQDGGTPAASSPWQRLDPALASHDMISSADLILLDHPGKLSQELTGLLASLLKRGRGLLYVSAEPVDAANLAGLAAAAGSNLQLPVEFAPAAGGRHRHGLSIAAARRDQSPFSVFGDSLLALIGSLRFSGGLDTRSVPGTLADDVLATFSDRSACLVVGNCGSGTLAVLNLDLNESDLAVSAMFVPLVQELADRLLATRKATLDMACGEPWAAYLPAEAGPATGLAIFGPVESGTAAEGELQQEAAGVLWRTAAAGPPGAYRIERDGQTVFAAAAALSADESDLRPLPFDVLTERLAGGRQIDYRTATATAGQRDDLWVWLAVACVGFMLAEWLALRFFGN
ncbi:MAG: BatA domain-containing protein [Pirellulales bacterium]